MDNIFDLTVNEFSTILKIAMLEANPSFIVDIECISDDTTLTETIFKYKRNGQRFQVAVVKLDD